MPAPTYKNYRVPSARWNQWDYSWAGRYFITICTKDRKCYFGHIANGIMAYSQIGDVVKDEWQKTAIIRPYVQLGEWVIMPNHIHGIIYILPKVKSQTPGQVSTIMWKPKSLGAIINQFKAACTKRIWADGYTCFGWQSRFYDRVIRDELEMGRIQKYIVENSKNWETDELYVETR